MNIENNEFGLVGARPEDQSEKVIEDVASDGQPLWMAFLPDPEALTVSKEDVQEAKNALIEVQHKHPEVVELCKHSSIPECAEAVKQAA